MVKIFKYPGSKISEDGKIGVKIIKDLKKMSMYKPKSLTIARGQKDTRKSHTQKDDMQDILYTSSTVWIGNVEEMNERN